MPEARDRLSRPHDFTLFIHRRSIGSTHVHPDITHTPFRWGTTAMTETTGTPGVRAAPVSRLKSRIPRVVYGSGRTLYGSPAVANRQNTPGGSGRRTPGSRTLLPSWYPRKPLADITPIVQAIERRRARLREVEGQQPLSPLPHGESSHTPFVPVSGAPLEHKLSVISPTPTIRLRHCPPTIGKVPKMLLDITNQNAGQDCLTPQKKLLNSIDKVEKVVMEELDRLKRTPTARRAEREKKVRTLMSMR